MISSRIVACALISVASVAIAFEDLGPIETARRDHPNIFVPEEVNVVDINSVSHYVFSGQAEKCFPEETDSELREEAVMSAKNVFYAHLSGEKEGVKISMSGCKPLYRLHDGNVFTMIMCVPRDKVLITTEKTAATETHAPAVVLERKPELTASVPTPESNGPAEKAELIAEVQAPATEKPDPAAEQPGSSSAAVQTPAVENQPATQEEAHVDIDLRIAKLRERLDANPADWRVRRRLAKLFVDKGNKVKAAKFYDTAVRDALKDKDILEEERIEIVYETARACEAGSQTNLAIKYYRMLLHMNVPFEVRKAANAKVASILATDESVRLLTTEF